MLHMTLIDQRYDGSGSGDLRVGNQLQSAGGAGRYVAPSSDEFAQYAAYSFAGWDGDDAKPITRETIDAARRFSDQLPRGLLRPDIAPGADGTLGFEWRFPRPNGLYAKVFIDVGPGAVIRAYRNLDGVPTHWPLKSIGYGSYSILRDVFEFLHERG